jgi:hypothetical protein
VAARDRPLEVAHPGLLPVALIPRAHRVGEQVQLHSSLALSGPHVGQRAAELGVPEQRRQVVDRHRHPDVIDGGVRERLDGAVGERAAAKQPDVARPGGGEGVLEAEADVGHGA